MAMPLLAYHLTWTCYGQWLPGDDRGYVDRRHRVPGTPYPDGDPQRYNAAANALSEAPCWLNPCQRRLAAEGIGNACAAQGWAVAALNVQPDHVHALVQTPGVGGRHAIRVLKAFATRRLRQAFPARRRWWTKGGKVETVLTQQRLAQLVRYVENQRYPAVP